MANRILLLGAGFSRNWGGLLASEIFNALLQRSEVINDPHLKNLLWDHKDSGGFENALAQVQQDFRNNPAVPDYKQRLDAFQAAIDHIFGGMDRGFSKISSWEFTNERDQTLLSTLIQFDAIFTLNQDLLFERFYIGDQIMLESRQRWMGVKIPGITEHRDGSVPHDVGKSRWAPLPKSEFKIDERYQSYFKLHGSWRWDDGAGRELLVMGGSKATTINGHPILAWYFNEFEHRLRGDTRLMVIGYGFNDPHINNAILKVAEDGALQMFIIDPRGVDVSHPDRNLRLKGSNPFQNVIRGSSIRTLREIFGSDAVEHIRVKEFLDR